MHFAVGWMKTLLNQRMDEDDDEQLAHKLNITAGELLQLNHNIDTEEIDDAIIHSYFVSLASVDACSLPI